MYVTAIVPAAGYGTRMKDTLPKQFHVLGDRPILFHTIKRLSECHKIDDMIVAVPEQHLEFAKIQYQEEYPVSKPVHFVTGGADRQDSVRAALQALPLDCDLVVIHDGVRPFVSNELLVNTIKAAEMTGAAAAAVRPRDTVKLVEPGYKAQNLPREHLYMIQTPQAFKVDIIKEAHDMALADGFSGTDDSILVERLGHKVAMVDGHILNFKITTPEGIVVAQALLKHRGA